MGVARQPGGAVVDQAIARIAVEHRIGNPGHDPVHQLVTQLADGDRGSRQVLDRMPDRGGQPDDRRHVQGAGSHIALLPAAMQQRGDGHLAAQQQRPRTVGSAQLVPGQGERRGAGSAEIHRQLADCLDRVGVQRHPVAGRDLGQLADRRDGADLVVRPHHSHQGHRVGVAGQRGAQGLGVHPAVAVHLEPLHLRALVISQPGHRVEHRMVFDGGGEHPDTARVGGTALPEQPLDGEVVALRATPGKDHLRRAGTKRLSNALPALFDRATSPTPRPV